MTVFDDEITPPYNLRQRKIRVERDSFDHDSGISSPGSAEKSRFETSMSS